MLIKSDSKEKQLTFRLHQRVNKKILLLFAKQVFSREMIIGLCILMLLLKGLLLCVLQHEVLCVSHKVHFHLNHILAGQESCTIS